jgi:hypothetical protein
MIDFTKLTAPFDPNKVSWRIGSTTADKQRGMALAYIDARDVMERLDEVCGIAGWQCAYPHAEGKKTICSIGIKINDEWIWKADGAGDSDVEAEKGALSDAFKRAAVKWGVGRYLYEVDAPWVEIEPMGRSFKIADKEHQRLARVLGAQAPRSVEEKPKEQEPPAGRAHYVAECKKKIASFPDGDQRIKSWWDAEAQARRDFELEPEDVTALKNLVIAKLPKKVA